MDADTPCFAVKGSFLSYIQFNSYAETAYELYIRIKTPSSLWGDTSTLVEQGQSVRYFHGEIWRANEGHVRIPRWWHYGY